LCSADAISSPVRLHGAIAEHYGWVHSAKNRRPRALVRPLQSLRRHSFLDTPLTRLDTGNRTFPIPGSRNPCRTSHSSSRRGSSCGYIGHDRARPAWRKQQLARFLTAMTVILTVLALIAFGIALQPIRRWAFAGLRQKPRGVRSAIICAALGFYWSLPLLIPPAVGITAWGPVWPAAYLSSSVLLTLSLRVLVAFLARRMV